MLCNTRKDIVVSGSFWTISSSSSSSKQLNYWTTAFTRYGQWLQLDNSCMLLVMCVAVVVLLLLLLLLSSVVICSSSVERKHRYICACIPYRCNTYMRTMSWSINHSKYQLFNVFTAIVFLLTICSSAHVLRAGIQFLQNLPDSAHSYHHLNSFSKRKIILFGRCCSSTIVGILPQSL